VFEDDQMIEFVIKQINIIDEKNVRYKLKNLVDEALYKNILQNYTSHALKIVIKPLMNEYYILKETNKLKSTSKSERWEEFLNIILGDKFVLTFLSKYTVMVDQLTIKFNDYIQFCIEIIKHYEYDCLEIDQKYNGLGKIIEISTNLGDLHNGKTVSLITFENGKLIYKPRNLLNDRLFYNIVKWLSKHLTKIDFYYPFMLSRDNYAWQEFIPYTECNNEEEVFHFYREAGVYLFILYLLNTNDMHYENLICNGEHPFIVDFETISQAYIKPFSFEKGDLKSLELSVLHTIFIPYVPPGGLFDFNLSALFLKQEISDQLEVEVLLEDEEYDWVFMKKKVGSPEGHNTVKLGSYYIEDVDVKAHLIQAFEDSSEVVLLHKDNFFKFLEELLDDQKYESRQLLRPTQVYHRYIEVSKRPELLSNPVSFDHIFDTFLNNFEPSNHGYLRVEYEIEEMKKGNIPLFYTTFDSRNLYANDKIVCENYYADTIKDNILKRFKILDNHIVNYQIELIEMSIASTMREDNYICEFNSLKDDKVKSLSYIDKVVKQELDYFQKMKIDIDGKRATFFLLQNEGEKFKIKPIGFDLYQNSGIVLLLAYAGFCYKNNELKQYAMQLIKQLNNSYNNLLKNEQVIEDFSVFNGLGGLLYINYNFYKLYNDEMYLEQAQKFINQMLSSYTNQQLVQSDLDYISGLSGTLVVICRMIKNKHYMLDSFIKELMQKYVSLVEKKSNNIVGLAHGISGTIVVLAEWYTLTREDKYLRLIQDLINQEDILINESNLKYTWCRGMGGVLYTRILVNKMVDNYDFSSNYTINTINMNNFFAVEDISLCHGLYGNIDIMYSLKKMSNIDQYDKLIYHQYFYNQSTLKFFDKSDYKLHTFMLGYSGIMYTLLRIKYNLPSVLNLEIFEEM